MTDVDISRTAYCISGKDENKFVISAACLSPSEASNSAIRKIYDLDNRDKGIQNPFNPSEVFAALQTVEGKGEWPPIVRLDASLPPVSLERAGAHYLVISAIEADSKKLAFDNTWEESKDRNGRPSVHAAEIALSVFSSKIAPGAAEPALLSRVSYFQNHPGQLKTLIKNWLDLQDKLKSAYPATTALEYEQQHPDPELKDWIARHPDDKQLTLWKSSIEEWLSKYPAERPNH